MPSNDGHTSTWAEATRGGWRKFLFRLAIVIGVVGISGTIVSFTPIPIGMLFPESGDTEVMLMFIAPGLFYPFAIGTFLYGFQPGWVTSESIYFRIAGPTAFLCLSMVGVIFGSFGFLGDPPQETIDLLGAAMIGFLGLAILIGAIGGAGAIGGPKAMVFGLILTAGFAVTVTGVVVIDAAVFGSGVALLAVSVGGFYFWGRISGWLPPGMRSYFTGGAALFSGIALIAVGVWQRDLLIAVLGLGTIAAWAGITLATRHRRRARGQ